MTKKSKILWTIAIFVFISVVVLGTVFDLQISIFLARMTPGKYYSENWLAIVGECFSENVLYILLICSFAILFYYLKAFPIKRKWGNVVCQIFCCGLSVGTGLYCIYKTLKYLNLYTNFGLADFFSSILGTIIIVLSVLIIVFLAFLIFSNLESKSLSKLWKWALIVIVIAAVSNGIVQASKLLFDRMRYRAMVVVGDNNFSFFTHWFKINDNKTVFVSQYVNDFFKSFPSGHTCAAASTFTLILLPLFLPQTNNKKWKTVFWTTAIFYTFLTAFSRIVSGAHFFMDVFVGGMFPIILVLVTKIIFESKNKKDKQNKSS